MLFDDTYHTIGQPAEALFKDKGSKFQAFAYPVKTEAEVKDCLQSLRKAHPKANHHCYAYRLGAGKLNARSNDDGEPSGTAGKPILNQIQSQDLTDILIVVVRYFGGTLLGVSGLINAYKTAAAEAIKTAIIIEKQVMCRYRATFLFEHTSEIMKILKTLDAKITSQGYDDQGFIEFSLRRNYSAGIEDSAAAHASPFLSLKFMSFS